MEEVTADVGETARELELELGVPAMVQWGKNPTAAAWFMWRCRSDPQPSRLRMQHCYCSDSGGMSVCPGCSQKGGGACLEMGPDGCKLRMKLERMQSCFSWMSKDSVFLR